MTTSLIYDDRFLLHNTGTCPESTERYKIIFSTIKNDHICWESLIKKSPQAATIPDILRCHDSQLIEKIESICNQGGGFLDTDTVVCPESYAIALLSAGAAITAVDSVLTSESNNAFSLARPPGHHATPHLAMGFCLFNNAAIAARYAQYHYNIKKVLIIDWDVHHGNGTQDIFYEDPSVFYFSIHEFPFYPGTGAANETGTGDGAGTTLNTPLPAHTPVSVYRHAFTTALQYIEKKFTPELIIISAGFDARKGDPLADFLLTGNDYFEMTTEVIAMAKRHCAGRVISILEGGYVSETLGDTVRQHVLGLIKG
jgi:acetoin utilization deacetylase AcuC-like enzyme